MEVVVGGDFNDRSLPNMILDLKKSSPKIFTRFNTLRRENTTIDHFYSKYELKIGTLVVLRNKEELEAAKNSRKQILSDHVVMMT